MRSLYDTSGYSWKANAPIPPAFHRGIGDRLFAPGQGTRTVPRQRRAPQPSIVVVNQPDCSEWIDNTRVLSPDPESRSACCVGACLGEVCGGRVSPRAVARGPEVGEQPVADFAQGVLLAVGELVEEVLSDAFDV